MKQSSRGLHILALGTLGLAVAAIGLFSPSKAGAESRVASLVVPPGGLEFRTPEGHILARLSSSPAGGVLELYDANEHPASVWQTGSAASPARLGAIGESEERLDVIRDPWAPAARSRSGAGF